MLLPLRVERLSRLAQLVERKTFNLVVVGSSPTVGAQLLLLFVFARFFLASVRQEQTKKGHNTRDSHVVTHRSTSRARRCLTAEIGRDPVYSAWYGRVRHPQPPFILSNNINKQERLGKNKEKRFQGWSIRARFRGVVSVPSLQGGAHSTSG